MRGARVRNHSELLLAVLFLTLFIPIRTYAAEPMVQKAQTAPAKDLAEAYLFVRNIVKFYIPIAEKGVRVRMPGESITLDKNNAASYRKKYERRLLIYEDSMVKRGAKNIAGKYRGKATQSCRRSQSMWDFLEHSEHRKGIVIIQKGNHAKIEFMVVREGRTIHMNSPAVVVESTVVAIDPMNSSYFYYGKMTDQGIVFKPDPKVLKSWPKWANPPSLNDIQNCSITFETESKKQ